MASTIEQGGKSPGQVYRTAEETPQAFRPRYDVQTSKTVDATKDIESLLGDKASINQQEHAVSVGIAKRMANDHVMSMNEEIKFINEQMGPETSRKTATKRLQQSIAATSGVSAGLSGDAAQAYDQMYIGPARKLATDAISRWDKEQDVIDANTVKNEFKTFMENTYSDLDADSQKVHLAAWGERFSSFSDVTFGDVEKIGVDNLTKTFMAQVKANPEGNPFEMANRQYAQYAKIEDNGTITFNTTNAVVQKSISDAVYQATQPRLRLKAAQELKESQEAYDDANRITSANITVMNQKLNAYVERYGIDMENLGGEELDKYEAYKSGLIEEYGINTESTTTDAEILTKVTGLESGGDYNAKASKNFGSEFTAFGRYQFTKATAQRMWAKAGIPGQMVHGKQTKAQQDQMWEAQKAEVKQTLKNLGRELTPGNFYVVHQMGAEGAKRYFNGNMTQLDIERMNVNIGNKYANPNLKRAQVIQAWRTKHLKGELTEAQAIKTQGLLDIAAGEVAYRERVGERKDAVTDMQTAKKLQTSTNEAFKAGTISSEQKAGAEGNIDSLLANPDISNRDRSQFYSLQDNAEALITDVHAAKGEGMTIDKIMATTAQLLQETPTMEYNQAFEQATLAETGEENFTPKFLINQMDILARNASAETKLAVTRNEEIRKEFIEQPLNLIENSDVVSLKDVEQAGQYYDQMTAVEKKRYQNAANNYTRSNNFIRDTYAQSGYNGEVPEMGQIDPLTGLMMGKKIRDEILTMKEGKFNLDAQIVFGAGGKATPGQKQEMNRALNASDGVDSEVLDSVAKKIGESMIQSPAAFATEYAKYPELFAQPRFRVAVMNSLTSDKEKGNWYAFEALSKQAVIAENQRVRDHNEKPANKNDQIDVDYANMPQTMMNAESAILLQNAESGMVPEKSLETMKDAGMQVKNYVNIRESLEDMGVPPTEREAFMRVANKMVRAGLDHMIPGVATNMGYNYIPVASGINGQATRRIQKFFEGNPETYQKPYSMVADLLSNGKGFTTTIPQAKELIDEGKISIIENGARDTMQLVYTASTGETISVDFTEDYRADDKRIRITAPRMRRF